MFTGPSSTGLYLNWRYLYKSAMRRLPYTDCLVAASYYAPRGADRLMRLGGLLSGRYLTPADRLIGIIGEPGMGKSSLIRGMFPGLELTSDDEGIKVRPLPITQVNDRSYFSAHTYHLDVRLETAFTQLGELAELIMSAVRKNKRVVVEHFELIYPVLGINAELLAGIGEEIIIARPDIFGPYPEDIYKSIEGSGIYRKMAHSAEDLTGYVLREEYDYAPPDVHSDFPRGFVIEFPVRPSFDIEELERKVKALIKKGLNMKRGEGNIIFIRDKQYPCAGPRIHVDNSREIINFRLLKKFYYDPLTETYKLVGLVGRGAPKSYTYQLYFDKEKFE